MNSKLVKGSHWVREQFEKGSRPTEKTLIRWIQANEVPGQLIEGKPYVYADMFIAGLRLTAQNQPDTMTGTDLLR